MPKKNGNGQVSEAELEQELLVTVSTQEAILITTICMMTPMKGNPGIDPDDKIFMGIPVLTEGVPGIGKTERTESLMRDLMWASHPLFVGQHPPEDFSGALIPDGKGGVKQICPLASVRSMIEAGKEGVIIMDEVNQAPPATQGAAQVLIHERVAGDQKVPGRVRFVAMCNPEKMAAGGYRMAPSLANRFVHLYDLGPKGAQWRAWRMGGFSGVDTEAVKAWPSKIKKNWRVEQGNTGSLFCGYIEHAGLDDEYLTKMPDLNHPSASRAWQSCRTLTYADRLYTTATILGVSQSIKEKLVEAAIGKGNATPLFEYFAKADLPSAADVLSGKWKVKQARGRADIIMAAYTNMVSYVTTEPDAKRKLDMGAQAWERLDVLFEEDCGDLVVDCVDNLKHNGLGRRQNKSHKGIEKASRSILIKLKQGGIDKYVDDLV